MKLKRISTIAVGAVLALMGCNSFNTYHLPPDDSYRSLMQRTYLLENLRANKDISPDLQAQALSISCPVYVKPEIPKTPELPWNEIAKIAKNDVKALDQIRNQHLKDLRQHIAEVKTILANSYQKYLEQCGDLGSTPSPLNQ